MATPALWSPAPKALKLTENELHVWRASLVSSEAMRRQFETILTEEEKRRAERFLVADAREHFVVARGILRELLGRYTGLSASEIMLSYGPNGKPLLALPRSPEPIRFNVSHSHGYGAFVFSVRQEVGIDIERIRPEAAGEDIAKRFFSKEEIEQLSAMRADVRTEGFFRCWTRKEAYVKAQGEGLQMPLDSFTVTVANEEPQELAGGDGVCWSLYPFEPARGFAGAVAARGKGWRLRFWEWQASEV